jgi:hypothetical protein
MTMNEHRPYVASGKTARERLDGKSRSKVAACRAGETSREVTRCRQSLRGFKQVINLFAVSAIIFTPLIGILSRDAVAAAMIACSFLLLIWLLEMMECSVKRRLAKELRGAPAKPTPEASPAREESF